MKGWTVLGLLSALGALTAGCGGAAPNPRGAEDEAESDAPPPTYAIALRLEDGGTDEDDTPHTRVRLVRIAPDGERAVADLGEERAACYYREAPGALIAATCWWAGAGGTYELRREGGAVVAYRTPTDEDAGSSAAAEAGRVDVPGDAVLQVLAPSGATSDPLSGR